MNWWWSKENSSSITPNFCHQFSNKCSFTFFVCSNTRWSTMICNCFFKKFNNCLFFIICGTMQVDNLSKVTIYCSMNCKTPWYKAMVSLSMPFLSMLFILIKNFLNPLLQVLLQSTPVEFLNQIVSDIP